MMLSRFAVRHGETLVLNMSRKHFARGRCTFTFSIQYFFRLVHSKNIKL